MAIGGQFSRALQSDPNLVTDEDCEEFITLRGKGWACEIDNQIVGFAIADL